MLVRKSLSHDPVFNLELEEQLLAGDGDILLLYINSPSVIVGRNQCIEAEVDLAWCAANNVPVLRRISGGGAVWHDLGNINFAFITGAGRVNPTDAGQSAAPLDQDPLAPIVGALAALGVHATVGKRHELLVGGLKISGTASHQSRGRRLFHGTLLHNTGLAAMQKALQGNPAKRGRKIASVPAKVMNLRTLPGLDIPTETLLDRLAALLGEQN